MAGSALRRLMAEYKRMFYSVSVMLCLIMYKYNVVGIGILKSNLQRLDKKFIFVIIRFN